MNISNEAYLLNKINLKTSAYNQWTQLVIDEIKSQYGDTVVLKDKSLIKFGKNPDLNIATSPETIWLTGGNEVYVNDNTITTIVSTSVLDTQDMIIEGHTISGSEFTFVTQTVTLNGTTPVLLTTPLARSSRLYNNDSDDIVGTVTVYDTLSNIHLTLTPGVNQSEKCVTTFSNVDYACVTEMIGGQSSKNNSLLEFSLQVREVDKVWRTKYNFGASTSTTMLPLQPYIIIKKNSDVRLSCISNTNNTEVFGSIHFLLFSVVP